MTDPFLFPDLERIADTMPAAPRGLAELRAQIRTLPAGLPSSLTGTPDVMLDEEAAAEAAQATPAASMLTTGEEPGTLPGIAVTPGSISVTEYASTIVPPRLVSGLPTLPDAAYPADTIVYNTVDKKLYKTEDGTSWVAMVNTDDLTGQVSAAQILAHTITANEVAANTLTAGEIAAGAIGVSELAAGAVTAGKIAAGAVTADKLSIGNTGSVIPLTNAGFEMGDFTGWGLLGSNNVEASDNSGYYGFSGYYRAVLYKPVGQLCLIDQRSFPARENEVLMVSALMGATSACSARFQIVCMDRSGAEIGWPSSDFSVIPGAGNTQRYSTRHTLPAGTYYVGVRVWSLTDLVYLLVDDVSVSRSAAVLSSDGNVFIDHTGIRIENGKLTFLDQYGSLAMDGTGFGESWADYIQTGVPNGCFTRANSSTDLADFWSLQRYGTGVALDIVDDSAAPGGHKVRYSTSSTHDLNSGNYSYLESDFIPVTGPAWYVMSSYWSITTSGAWCWAYINWYNGAYSLLSQSYLNFAPIGSGFAVVIPAVQAHQSARYAKVAFAIYNPSVAVTQADLLLVSLKHHATTQEFIPPGTIVLWSGSSGNVPIGWYLCDGSNGTPNLTDRFVVGGSTPSYGGSYSPTGALPTHSTHSAGGSHAHNDHYHSSGTYATGGGSSSISVAAGSSQSGIAPSGHTHDVSGVSGTTSSSTEGSHTHDGHSGHGTYKYYVLCYIMKS